MIFTKQDEEELLESENSVEPELPLLNLAPLKDLIRDRNGRASYFRKSSHIDSHKELQKFKTQKS